MIGFVQMSRGWIWVFAIVITVLFAVAAVNVAAPNLKKHVNLVAAALALWSFFYFYALLASQKGAVTIDADWWAAHKKATASALTVAVSELTALLAWGVLPEPWAGRVAAFLAAIAPLLGFLGVKAAPANKPLP